MENKIIKRNKRIFQELQNFHNNNLTSIHKKPKIEVPFKDENCNIKEAQQDLIAKNIIKINIIIHPEAENILQNLTDEHFVKCFNLDKIMVRCLLMELHQRTYYVPEVDDIPLGVSFDLSVLATLSYIVNGHFECVTQLEYFMDCSSNVLKKCVCHVSQIIVNFLTPEYIRFPSSSKELQQNKTEFLQQFGVPGVVGVIDCFHVYISEVSPHEEHLYLNRHLYKQSLTVQVICDKKLRFLDANPRFSGFTHSHHIWQRSHIRHMLQHIQEKDPKSWLVGQFHDNFNNKNKADRGYYLTTGIINPYRNAIHKQQKDVNAALNEILEVVAKAFSILKARFKCLSSSLPFNHKNSANIITSCFTLHNYLIAKHQAIDSDDLSYDIPKKTKLPNARHEDQYSRIATDNREFIKCFLYNNSIKN